MTVAAGACRIVRALNSTRLALSLSISVVSHIFFNPLFAKVVDGNWGVHADIPKWVFEADDGPPYDYSCTTSMGPGRRRRRRLEGAERRSLLEEHGVVVSPEEYAGALFDKVTAKSCETCSLTSPVHKRLANKFLDAKLVFAENRMKVESKRPHFED